MGSTLKHYCFFFIFILFNQDDGYNALINDKIGNPIWLKKVNYTEEIKLKNLKFTDIDLKTFEMVSKKSNGFNSYIKKELKNSANRY